MDFNASDIIPIENIDARTMFSEGLITIENCKSYVSTTESMNTFYLIACISLLILWIITAWKAGWLDKEINIIKSWIK